jgi:hypothetical protein
MRRLRWVGLVCLVVAAACSDGYNSSSSSSTSTSSSGAVGPNGKSIGNLSLTGDGGLSGAASGISVRCDFPDLAGESIAVLGTAYDTSTSLQVRVLGGRVTVRLFAGSGADFHERAFEGTGVTGFDVAKGAQIDSQLIESAATGGATPGPVGAVTAIKGSLDCGDQQPGSSAVTLTGDTPEGALAGATLAHARVECNQDSVGNEAVALGIVDVGSTKVFVTVELRADGLGVTETLESGVQHHFQAPGGAATVTSTGAHASGDAVEQGASHPHTIHVVGDVTCGTPT